LIAEEDNRKKGQREDQEHREYILAKNKDLEKQNTNLQDQLSKYALLLREEKNEKKELMSSYDELQQMLRTKLEQFNQIQLRAQRKYGTLLVLCWFAVFAAGLMVILYLIEGQLI